MKLFKKTVFISLVTALSIQANTSSDITVLINSYSYDLGFINIIGDVNISNNSVIKYSNDNEGYVYNMTTQTVLKMYKELSLFNGWSLIGNPTKDDLTLNAEYQSIYQYKDGKWISGNNVIPPLMGAWVKTDKYQVIEYFGDIPTQTQSYDQNWNLISTRLGDNWGKIKERTNAKIGWIYNVSQWLQFKDNEMDELNLQSGFGMWIKID